MNGVDEVIIELHDKHERMEEKRMIEEEIKDHKLK
jgi:hypothetical protein